MQGWPALSPRDEVPLPYTGPGMRPTLGSFNCRCRTEIVSTTTTRLGWTTCFAGCHPSVTNEPYISILLEAFETSRGTTTG